MNDVTKHNKLHEIKKAIEYFNKTNEGSIHHRTAIEALKLLEANVNADLTPHRIAMMQTLGWCYANVCIMLDKGVDPRSVDMMDVVTQFEKDFKLEETVILVQPH